MTNPVDLVVAPCSYEAARYAVMHWHYSKTMPAGKLVKFGVWENGKFIGSVLFGRGAIYNIGSPYGLMQTECVELVRVALTKHESQTSQIVTCAVKGMVRTNLGLRLIVSYADPSEGHNGAIYQAMNWFYVGDTKPENEILLNGKMRHRRSVNSQYGTYAMEWLRVNVDPKAMYINPVAKHKYLYPLDKAMRRQIEPLAKPYPKRADVGEIESRVRTTD